MFMAIAAPVCHTQRKAKVVGTLYVTNYQLIFIPNDPSVRLPSLRRSCVL